VSESESHGSVRIRFRAFDDTGAGRTEIVDQLEFVPAIFVLDQKRGGFEPTSRFASRLTITEELPTSVTTMHGLACHISCRTVHRSHAVCSRRAVWYRP